MKKAKSKPTKKKAATKKKSAPKSTKNEATFKELDKRSRELMEFSVKNDIPMFMAASVNMGKHNKGVGIIHGNTGKLANMIGSVLDENKLLQIAIIMRMSGKINNK